MTQLNRPTANVRVNLREKSYPIHIGENTLSQIGEYVKELGVGQKIMVVTNPTVRELYGKTVIDSLTGAGFDVITGEVPDGEKYKSLDSASYLYDIAFDHNMDRKCAIVALGGGVIGDLAGFVAATYMRGIPFIQIPTTLLAQVDSSVGGKVAVNHPRGKNIIGAFYQPQMVYTDIKTLYTLPEREFRAGMAEVIKYGVIWDHELFDFLEQHHFDVKRLGASEITRIVETSCNIKARVVEQDETEQSLRAILNYGHTFGHAFEALTGYNFYVHGEAVAIGMITAAEVAVKLGLLKIQDCDRIRNLVRLYGLPEKFEKLASGLIIESMSHDKKVQAGKVRYILPEKIGRVKIVADIPQAVLQEVLTALQDKSDIMFE